MGGKPNKVELHNALSREFVTKVMREILVDGGSIEDAMRVAESVVLSVILSNESVFGASRRVSAEMLEMMATRVAERLAAIPEGGRHKEVKPS